MGVTGGLIALVAALATASGVGVTLRRRAGRFRPGPGPDVLTEADLGGGLCLRPVWPAKPEIVPAPEVTVPPSPHSIGFVIPRRAKTLTKRRAVDFCRVATAICPRSVLS